MVAKEKLYIFVSHSHKDIEVVRKIRNYLESLNGEPILFFLKSKNDENEITQLIKDEIDARIWFIYCKSNNSESSNWCKKEREYVTNTGKRNIIVDIENCLDQNGNLTNKIKADLKKIVENFDYLQTLFVSYSHRDYPIIKTILDLLSHYGIKTWDKSAELISGSDFVEQTMQSIKKSPITLLFLSKNSCNLKWIDREIAYSVANAKNIVPVCLGDALSDCNCMELIKKYGLHQRNIFSIDISSTSSIEKSTLKLVSFLQNMLH